MFALKCLAVLLLASFLLSWMMVAGGHVKDDRGERLWIP